MATKRKSFVLHIDSLDILDDLSNGQAGVLFKAIKAFQNGEPLDLDSIVKIAFSPFKNQFARDDIKYENLCEKNRLIAINRHSTKSTSGTSGNQTKPVVTKSTDNDSDSDSDSDSKDITSLKNDGFCHWWNTYPKKTAKPDALKAFKAKTKTMNDEVFMKFVDLISSDSGKRYKETEKQFIPAPAKYIRQELYEDEQ